MNQRIFREYDIRGVVDADLTDDVVCLIGRGFPLTCRGRARAELRWDGTVGSALYGSGMPWSGAWRWEGWK